MGPNHFVLKPNQKALIEFMFLGENEVDVDVLHTSTKENYIEGHIAKRIAYRSTDQSYETYDTGINNSTNEKSYNIQACYKNWQSGNFYWSGFASCKRDSPNKNVSVITFDAQAHTPVSMNKQALTVSVKVTIK